jgi:hypothetical protein
MSDKNDSAGCGCLLVILFFSLIFLKIIGLITWGWLVILSSPIWFPFFLIGAFFIFVIVISMVFIIIAFIFMLFFEFLRY